MFFSQTLSIRKTSSHSYSPLGDPPHQHLLPWAANRGQTDWPSPWAMGGCRTKLLEVHGHQEFFPKFICHQSWKSKKYSKQFSEVPRAVALPSTAWFCSPARCAAMREMSPNEPASEPHSEVETSKPSKPGSKSTRIQAIRASGELITSAKDVYLLGTRQNGQVVNAAMLSAVGCVILLQVAILYEDDKGTHPHHKSWPKTGTQTKARKKDVLRSQRSLNGSFSNMMENPTCA